MYLRYTGDNVKIKTLCSGKGDEGYLSINNLLSQLIINPRFTAFK